MLDIASGTLCTHSQLKTAAPPYKVPTGQYGSGSGNGSQRNTVKDPPLPDGHWLLHASNPQIIIQFVRSTSRRRPSPEPFQGDCI